MISAELTRVVNLRVEPYDVYIGRGSKWGNPFSHLRNSKAKFFVSTREESVEEYEKWVISQPDIMNSLHELLGKRLG